MEKVSCKKKNLFCVSVVENGVDEASGAATTALPDNLRPPDDAETDSGPAETGSSDGEPGNPAAGPRHGRRTPPGHQNSSVRKPPRAKSQPAIGTKEVQRTARQDQPERRTEVRRSSSGGVTFML